MANKSSSRGRKGKVGKGKHRIAAYYNSGRNLFNKARRLAKHLKRYAGDQSAPDVSAQKALKVAVAGMPLGLSKRFNKEYGL